MRRSRPLGKLFTPPSLAKYAVFRFLPLAKSLVFFLLFACGKFALNLFPLLFLFNNYNKFFFEAVFEVQRSFIFDFFIQFYLAFPTNQHFYYITLAQKTENFCVIFFTRPCRGFVFLCFSVLGFVFLNFRCRLGRRFLLLFWLGLGFRL